MVGCGFLGFKSTNSSFLKKNILFIYLLIDCEQISESKISTTHSFNAVVGIKKYVYAYYDAYMLCIYPNSAASIM